MEERQLAERCARGERQACRELYDCYAGRLLALGMRYTGSQETAEDVLQDSFIKAFSSLGSFRYRGEGSLYAWLRRIVVNRCVDWLRERKKNVMFSLEEARTASDEDTGSTEVEAVPEDVLAGMLESLPEGYRTVFNLFAIDGYSHREIGKMLGIKEKSSSSQFFRARALLAEKIKEYIKLNG